MAKVRCLSVYSYIKPQLRQYRSFDCAGCLSVYSYIKPQLGNTDYGLWDGVYLSIPTSNHNS